MAQPMPRNHMADKLSDLASLLDCAEVAMCGLIAEGVNDPRSASGIRSLIMDIAERVRSLSESIYPSSSADEEGGDD